MPGTRRERLQGLTESWDNVEDDAQSIDLTSDEDFSAHPPKSLPGGRMSSSRSARHGDLLHPSLSQATPRQRHSTKKQSATSSLVMPKLEHSPSQDNAQRTSTTRSPKSSPKERGDFNVRRSLPRMARKQQSDRDSTAMLIWDNFLSPSLAYIFSVLGIALRFAKPIIGYALAIYVLVGGMIMLRNLLFSSISSSLAPICSIPGASRLGLPFCPTFEPPARLTHGQVEFDKLIQTQSALEDVLATTAESASLPVDMKRSETSIRDLRLVVQYSSLPSRNELVFEFNGFVDTARQASQDLSRYNSKIGHAVDRILSTNRWTLQVIDGLASSAAPQGSISRALSAINIFAPFMPSSSSSLSADSVLYDQYLRHTGAIEEQIATLIIQAQALLSVLNNLDERLDVIADIAQRDGIRITSDQDDLLSLMWTKLGGNRASVVRAERQLSVLGDVAAYRRLAVAHVAATVVKLQDISSGLEDLRERIASAETVGVDRIPLDVHIGLISAGVERLEAVRDESRRVEGARLKGILAADERKALDAGY